jgi:calcium/proton exchanger cax
MRIKVLKLNHLVVLAPLLLALGLAMLAGGLRHPYQRFNLESAKLATSMMFLAVAGLMIPAFFHPAGIDQQHLQNVQMRSCSQVDGGACAMAGYNQPTARTLMRICPT